MAVTETQPQKSRNARRVRIGTVSSDKGDKTIRVECQYLVKHRKYGKLIRRRTVLHAHDEKNVAAIGDKVRIVECRPISKTKHWRLVDVVNRA